MDTGDYSERSEEHTSELQSHLNLVCRLLLGSEEHTSELQSHLNLVCRLLLGKKEHTSELHSHLNVVCRLLLEKINCSSAHGDRPRTRSVAQHLSRRPRVYYSSRPSSATQPRV